MQSEDRLSVGRVVLTVWNMSMVGGDLLQIVKNYFFFLTECLGRLKEEVGQGVERQKVVLECKDIWCRFIEGVGLLVP